MNRRRLSPVLLAMVIALLALSSCVTSPTPAAAPTEAANVEPTAAPVQAPTQASTTAPAPPTDSYDALIANPWQWVAFTSPVGQFDVKPPESYLLTVNEDGTLDIVADCNNTYGTYRTVASDLTIDVDPTTLAACPAESRSEQFVKLLGSAAKYFFQDGKLFIDLFADGGTLAFAAAQPAPAASAAEGKAPAAAEPTPDAKTAALAAAIEQMVRAMATALTANPWQWTGFSGGGQQVDIQTPASYVATFHDDGTVDIRADCNNAGGTYIIASTSITITIGPVTAAACPDGSHSDQFIKLLSDATQFAVFGDALAITTKDGGSMSFSADVTTAVDLCGEKALALNKIEDTLDPKISAALDKTLAGFVQAGVQSAPGVSMLVTTPKGRYFKSTGVADVASCEPLRADAPYEIGSNTKMMTAAIIFQLQEEGELSTSDPLSKWLPDLAARIPNGDKVTIDMLLTHTSGIFDYFDVEAEGGAIANGTKDKAMLTRAFTPEELVKRVADSGQSYFEPGAAGKWQYSNTGYILLGLIIERATGKSYAENLKARIFEPLGLKKTTLLTGQPKPGTLPQGYYSQPFSYTTGEWNASQGWSAGAVESTSEEFAVFLKALFTGKLFRQASTLKLMQEHTEAGVDALGPGTIYAHGMMNNNGVLGHGGQTLGFVSAGGYIPDKDVTIVMWSNTATSSANRAAVPVLAKIVGAIAQ